MKYPPFSGIRPSTITMVARLRGTIDVHGMMHDFIQVVPGRIVPSRRKSKSRSNVKLQTLSSPGSIYSIRGPSGTRGIVCSASTKCFRHAETLRIEIRTKILCIKIASSSIHITGASSLEDGNEAAEWAVYHILTIQKALDNIRQNPELAAETVAWVYQALEGPNDTINEVSENEIPEYLDTTLAALLMSYTIDYLSFELYKTKVDHFMTTDRNVFIPDETHGDLAFIKSTPIMANYNYSLGFEIDRIQLKKKIRGMHGFAPRFDNNSETSVIIELPYEDNREEQSKNPTPHHTFTVHMSGEITQCSPPWSKREEAYNIFMQSVLSIKDDIILK